MSWIPTAGEYFPVPPSFAVGTSMGVGTSLVIDATGEKLSMQGSYWNPDRAAKTITKVGWRWGTAVKAGGSGLIASLQDLTTTPAGAGAEPDGTMDQQVAISAAEVTTGAFTLYTLGAGRSVTPGDLLACVVEFDGGGRLGSDSYAIGGMSLASSLIAGDGFGLFTHYVGGVWTMQTTLAPSLIFEHSDGTFGSIESGHPIVTAGSTAFNSGSTPDENGIAFTVPEPIKVDGAWLAYIAASNAADFDVVLYEDASTLVTVSIDAGKIVISGTNRTLKFSFPAEQTLVPGKTYRLVVKPTTANNVTFYHYDVASASYWTAAQGGPASFNLTTRTDGGAWSETTTRRAQMGLLVSARLSGLARLVNGGLVQ
jgi:hypothetical protein